MNPRHEEIDHTADIGIRVHASDMEDLCLEAARAMFRLILGDASTPIGKESCSVRARATDRDLLLRAWLSELLYIHASRRVILTEFRIRSITATEICAVVTGIPMTDDMIARATEIKAVTYHGLTVFESGGELHAQVIFDT